MPPKVVEYVKKTNALFLNNNADVSWSQYPNICSKKVFGKTNKHQKITPKRADEKNVDVDQTLDFRPTVFLAKCRGTQ